MSPQTHIRPEIHTLVWEYTVACHTKRLSRANRLLFEMDEFRRAGTATLAEGALWVGALNVSLHRIMEEDVRGLIRDAINIWTGYVREHDESFPGDDRIIACTNG
jgi:hypothetical protein